MWFLKWFVIYSANTADIDRRRDMIADIGVDPNMSLRADSSK